MWNESATLCRRSCGHDDRFSFVDRKRHNACQLAQAVYWIYAGALSYGDLFRQTMGTLASLHEGNQICHLLIQKAMGDLTSALRGDVSTFVEPCCS